MSKNSNGAGPVGPAAVHFVLQGKGGVGKSVVASWLAEFLASHGQKVCAIDADPINPHAPAASSSAAAASSSSAAAAAASPRLPRRP